MECNRARLAALALLPIAIAWMAHPQTNEPSEGEVKAAYLHHFAKFTTWPEEVTWREDEIFAVCVLGEDPFGDVIDTVLAGETIGERELTVRRVDEAEECGDCRIVFIAASEAPRLSSVLLVLNRTKALTVSEVPDFSSRGGMVEFVLDSDRVRFDVNLSAATRAGIVFSSELLKVARAVRRDSSRLPELRYLDTDRERRVPSPND